MNTPPLPYYLGLPAWAYAGWKGPFFPANRPPLSAYAQVFNTVEGNTTFYQIPDEKTVAGWREAVAGGDFKFCFKLPRSVTHERQPVWADLQRFLTVIEPLGGHLGPLLLQFPERIGPQQLDWMDALCQQLPRDFSHVIEVRHLQFFHQPELLEPLLERYHLGRVSMDSRPLYQGDRNHPEVVTAIHKKPDVPVLPQVYNDTLFLRLILHPDRRDNQRYIQEWVARTAQALSRDQSCYIMIHCPNNQHCPEMAVAFHEALRKELKDSAIPPLPAWPVPQQVGLF